MVTPTEQHSLQTLTFAAVAVVASLAVAVGCGDVEQLDGDEEVVTQTEPLFVDFQRTYEAPEGDYFDVDGITTVNPHKDDTLPMVIDDEVLKFSTFALNHVDIQKQALVFPREGFDDLLELESGDLVISSLRRAEFWRSVNYIETDDDAIIVHTDDAEFADVVELGDFYVAAEPGHDLPGDFDLMDPYLLDRDDGRSDVEQIQQGLDMDCIADHFDYDEVAGTSWYYDKRGDWQSDKQTPHQDWLGDRVDEVHPYHAQVYTQQTSSQCNEEWEWDIDEAHDDYVTSTEYQDYLDEYEDLKDDYDSQFGLPPAPDEEPPAPPTVVCLETYLEEQFAEESIEEYKEVEDDVPDDDQEIVDETCEYLDLDGDGEAFSDDDNVGYSDGQDAAGNLFETALYEVLWPQLKELADEHIPDPNCESICENNPMHILDEEDVDDGAGDSEKISQCIDECPEFQPCISEAATPEDVFSVLPGDGDDIDLPGNLTGTGEVCGELFAAGISLDVSFEYGFSINPFDPEAWVGLEATLGFDFGLKGVLTDDLNWNYSEDLEFPLPGLSFSVGPLEFGASLYLELGMNAGAFAEQAFEARYDASLTSTAKVGTSTGVSFDTGGDGFDYSFAGSQFGSYFNVYIAGGIGLYASTVGVGSASEIWDALTDSDDIVDAVLDLIDVQDDGMSRILSLDVLRATLSADATIAPPECTYDVGMYLATVFHYDIDLGITSFSGSSYVFGPYYLFREQGNIGDLLTNDYLNQLCPAGDDETMPEPPEYEDDQPTGCGTDADCGDDEACAGQDGAYCVDNEGLRLTLDWAPSLDLNLVVVAPDGTVHTVAGGLDDNFTVWNCGGTCGDEGVQDRYVENVLFDDPIPGNYQFYVIENEASPTDVDADQVDYVVELDHDDQRQRVGGTLFRDMDEPPVTYTFCVPDDDGDGCDDEGIDTFPGGD